MKRFIPAALICACLVACDSQQTNESSVEVNKEEVVVENILIRRSIRNYTDEPVTQEQLETLMQCAINAPSANNRQPWEVRVVQSPELLGKMRAINARSTYNSPVVIFIAGDTENKFSQFDCGLITQNILLAAESMGLGTVVVGSVVPTVLKTPEGKEIVDSLELPENYEVIVGICLGNKNEWPDAKPREAGKVKYIR
ncbi:MAG: nitroreductase [Tannerellaceae bacterium]|nr:nitroreductase [Tannerellaceae bacterium]